MNRATDHAVAQLFNEHGRALRLYARQWIDAASAEDVVQKVFVRMLAGGKVPADGRTWLFRCVRNEAIGAWRSIRRRDRRESEAGDERLWFVHQAHDRVDAEEATRALESLPPDQREIVILRIWSGLTLAQIGQVTGLAVSSVHARFGQAMAAMREQLESSCRNKNH